MSAPKWRYTLLAYNLKRVINIMGVGPADRSDESGIGLSTQLFARTPDQSATQAANSGPEDRINSTNS